VPPILLLALLSATCSAPIRVTPPEFSAAKEPQIAVDGSAVYVAYGMGDAVYVSTSSDAGKSFGKPIEVGSPGKLSLGMRRGPRITARDGKLTISAVYGVQGRGRDENLVAFKSMDRGKSWSGPTTVNTFPASAREGLHAMAQGPDGTVACAWLDLRGSGTELYLSTSKDYGATWSENRLIYSSPSGTICECCHPTLVYDAKGGLHALFRNSVDGARDMYAMSAPASAAFGKAYKQGSGSWMLKACPMDGGMAAVHNDRLETVWRREDKVYRSATGGQERLLGEGRDPWMTSVGGVPIYVWKVGKGLVWSKDGAPPIPLAPTGMSPVVVRGSDTKTAFAAWTDAGIMFAKLSL